MRACGRVPEMLRGPCPVRAPGLGPCLEFTGIARLPGEMSDGAPQPQVGCREGVVVAEDPHGYEMRAPRTDSLELAQLRHGVVEAVGGLQVEITARHCPCDADDGVDPALREPQSGEAAGSRSGQRRRAGEQVGGDGVRGWPVRDWRCLIAGRFVDGGLGDAEGNAETPGDAAAHGRCRGYRDLLTGHDPDDGLEPVPRSRHTQAGCGSHQRTDDRIVVQHGRAVGIGVGAQQGAGAVYVVDDRVVGRQVEPQPQMLAVGHVVHFGDADVTAHADGAHIGAVGGFHAGNRTRSVVGQERAEVEGRHVGDGQRQAAVDAGPFAPPALRAQLAGREPEEGGHGPVQLPRPAEAGRSRDGVERQVGLVDQPAGEVGAPGSGDGTRRGADVQFEQPSQVPGAVAHVGGECPLVVVIEEAVGDAQQCGGHGLGSVEARQ